MSVHTKIHAWLFIAVLFIIFEKWKQLKCPSKSGYVHVIYSYNGILYGNKNEWSTDSCYDMGEPWTPSETSQAKSSHALIHLYEISKIGTSIETERSVITRCSGGGD